MADNENTILTEENESTRIINLSEASEMDAGMYFVTDSSNGTRKVPITKLIDADLEKEYAAAPAKEVGDLKEDLNVDYTTAMQTGYAISILNGNSGPYTSTDCTDFIPVTPNSRIRLNHVKLGTETGVCFYTGDKSFLSAYSGETGIDITVSNVRVPANARYIRLSSLSGIVPSVSVEKLFPDYILPSYEIIPTVSKINESLAPYLKNIAEPADLAINGYINASTGVASSSTSWKCTDYVPVIAGTVFKTTVPTITTALSVGVAFYDANKTYISGVAGRTYTESPLYFVETVTTPETAAFARFCFRAANVNDFYAKSDVFKFLQINTYAMQMFEKIGVIGDSISVGWGSSSSRRNTGVSWVQQMARRLGCTAYNLGASGVDPIEWFQTDFEFYEYCLPQYQSVGFCDLYIIGLGLNGGTLGSVADINQADYTQNAETFYGQYARIIQMINAEHPDSIIMCLTEPTTRIASYDQAVRDICALNYIDAQLLDLENDYIDMFNTPEILAEHQPDDLHFTPYGYSLIADAMVKAISDYISKNPDPFKLVGIN